jgi:hypothetical protein
MACTSEELGWLRKLGRTVGGAVKKVDVSAWRPVDLANVEWRSFDLADAMEQGLAQELTSNFVTAPAQGEAKRLIVEDSRDGTQHILMSENGSPLLFARKGGQGESLDIYIATGGDPPTGLGPAFTVTASGSENETWTLTADRCEQCAYLPRERRCCAAGGRRELARIQHKREKLGQGTMMCMEVDLPELNAERTPVCSVARGVGTQRKLHLQSKCPVWSNKLRALTLDFHGRVKLASHKNFQLQRTGEELSPPNEPELLFGKSGENTFVLDYRTPLGMVEAFAIVLSTRAWI